MSSGTTLSSGTGPTGVDEVLVRGSRVGRYQVLDLLGAGSMGVVYSAFDPELDRRIALKLLRLPAGPNHAASLRDRLLREARALARLSPDLGVVTVYDVGVTGDTVFLALELVTGLTLRWWAKDAPRSSEEMLEVLLQAGRGLSGVHRAALVHGDFKPDNVMVAEDGRVRVTDFGLARINRRELTPAHPTLGTQPDHRGAVGGTPGYMAPELFEGAVPSALSDEFAFCVTAYECLFGHRPTGKRGLQEQSEASSTSPAHRSLSLLGVRRALQRGMSVLPEHRFASMSDLLRALERARAIKRWTPRLVLGALIAVTTAGVFSHAIGRNSPPACEESWRGVWDQPAQTRVQAAFTATQLPHAEAAFAAVKVQLDRYTHEGNARSERACRALQHPQGESRDAARAQMLCLRQRREDVRRLVETLEHADAQTARRSSPLDSLSMLEGCSALEAVNPRPFLPASEDARRHVETMQGTLALSRARMQQGRAELASQLASRALAEARELQFKPIIAEALLVKGELELESRGGTPTAEKLLREAALEADGIRADALAAEAWTAAAQVKDASAPELTFERLELAALALRRLGPAPLLEIRLLTRRGRALAEVGRFEEAVKMQQTALTLATSSFGAEDLRTTSVELAQGETLGMAGRFEQALTPITRAREALERKTAEGNPRLLDALNAEGLCLLKLGRPTQAREPLERAVKMAELSFGTDSPKLASPLGNLAGVLAEMGEDEQALSAMQRAIRLRESALGPGSPALCGQYINVGALLLRLRRPAEALRALETGRTLLGKSLGPTDDARSYVEQLLAKAHRQLGRRRRAK